MDPLSAGLAGLALIALGGAAHLALLAAERRGWIYYRHHRPPAGVGAAAMMEMAAVVEPEVAHVLELEREGDLHLVDAERGDVPNVSHREDGPG